MNKSDDIRMMSAGSAGRENGREPWEGAVREAFDAVRAPEELKTATLEAIEARRSQTGDAVASAGDSASRSAADARDSKSEEGGRSASLTRPGTMAQPSPQRKRRFRVVRRALAAAACVLAVAAGVFGFRLYNDPAAYVGIDINPSLELSVNTFGTVIGARPLNEDADAVLQSIVLEGKSYEDALAVLLQSEALFTYIDEDAYVSVGVTTDDDALASRLQGASDECLQSSSCNGSCHRVDGATRESAHHAGMGVGKYTAAQELIELDPSVSLEECADMSMRELRDRIEECGGEAQEGHHGMGPSGAGQNSGSQEGLGQNGSGQGAGSGSQGKGQGAQGVHGYHGAIRSSVIGLAKMQTLQLVV